MRMLNRMSGWEMETQEWALLGSVCMFVCGDRIPCILQGPQDHIETFIHSTNIKCAPAVCETLLLDKKNNNKRNKDLHPCSNDIVVVEGIL